MTTEQNNFLDAVHPYAVEIETLYGVPVLVSLAQACLESNYGRAKNANNIFGIKAGSSWKGKTNTVKTTEVINGKSQTVTATFRAYDSYRESFIDYAKLLQRNWNEAFSFKGNPILFAEKLVSGSLKYATDPNYLKKIAGVMTNISTKFFPDVLPFLIVFGLLAVVILK